VRPLCFFMIILLRNIIQSAIFMDVSDCSLQSEKRQHVTVGNMQNMTEIDEVIALSRIISVRLDRLSSEEQYDVTLRNTMEIYSWYYYKMENDLKDIFKKGDANVRNAR